MLPIKLPMELYIRFLKQTDYIMPKQIQAKFNITGLVQGVGYRFFVLRNAQILCLSGYAKNCYDGSVEVVAEGDETSLTELFSHLKQGPFNAHVKDVKVEYSEFKGIYKGFEVR
jgi:acylphosphatase